MSQTSAPLLTATGLRQRVGERTILDGVDLSLAPGESLAIMGPSGSGKSTLLYALSGMSDLDEGSVRLGEEEISRASEAARAELRLRRFGCVFQQPHLLATLNLVDNVALPGLLAARRSRREVYARAAELLERAGVAELADRDVTQASGGQLQRVGICRALINDPEIVFADEPTGALDSTTAEEVMALLAELHRGGTAMVIVTHDPGVAAHADRVVAVRDGRISGVTVLGTGPVEETTLAERTRQIAAWMA